MTRNIFESPVMGFARDLDRMLGASPLSRFVDLVGEAANTAETEGAKEWRPRVDVFEGNDKIMLLVDVPGLQASDIEMTVEKGVLTIKGARQAAQREDLRRHLSERPNGQFSRRFSLPETADEGSVSAKVTNGVLEVIVAKRAESAPRKIVISSN